MNTVLSYSGGLDSTVLLYHLLKEGHKVKCLSVDYGQRHCKELDSARNICLLNQVEYKVANLAHLHELFAGSSQTSRSIPVPDGHYAEESMKQTVVPNRNMVLLSLACAWAVATRVKGEQSAVAYAAHMGDHAIYPDCRPEFASAMGQAMLLCDWHEVKLIQPFLQLSMDKTAIVRLGSDLKVPFAETWSCYKGGEEHCGTCGTCVERREAFQLAGVDDPTTYEN